MSVLEVHDVSIRYITGDFKDIGLKEYVMRRLKNNYNIVEFWADHHITFSLEKGDMLGIIGTNGAGKSTLLKAVSGIMEPTGGYVKREGNIAALLELASGFDGDLTVRENTYLRGAMLGYTRKFMDEKYPEIIEFAELQEFQNRPFKQLSSGMMSRLAFSVASLVHPDILILDEVLSVGDGAFRRKSEAKMREIISGGATTIFVSHAVEQVRELCNKVLWIEKGNQIGFGDTDLLCDLYQGYLDGVVSLDEAREQLAAAGAGTVPEEPCQMNNIDISVSTESQKPENSAPAESRVDITQNKPLFDVVQRWLGIHFSHYYRLVFLGSFLLALLVHLYMFTNKFINHDDVNGLFLTWADGTAYGRWFLYPVTAIAGYFSSPWLDGIVAALFLAVSCTLMVFLFHVRHLLPALLLSACMVAFPVVTATYTYMFCASQYFLAMAMALLACYLIRRGRGFYALAGTLFLTLATGIYQAYFALAAAILVLTMLLDVCRGRWKEDFKGFICTGISYVGWLILSMILYFTVLKICLYITGMELLDYQGISSMGQMSLPILLTRLEKAYTNLWDYYFHNPLYSNFFPYLVPFTFLVDGAILVLILWDHHLYKYFAVLAELVLLISIFPLACNLIYLMVEEDSVYILMVYPTILPLLLPVLLGDTLTSLDFAALLPTHHAAFTRLSMAFVAGILLVLQAAVAYEFVIITNRTYMLMDLTYENTYAYFSRLTTKIELQQGYTPDTPVAIIGYAASPAILPPTYITGALTTEEALNMWSRKQFLTYFLNSPYNWATEEQIADVTTTQIYQEMPCYPSEGAITTINNVIVIKLS